ncbi:hypothetical protein [Bradyrhizobium retamae]|uniref:Uncharacterized protein n=1 Tax=Bradyrhizobium retamae TaxID=1300035 RepID=A0A0R3MQJ6_9BRAD|nr:hypothetical protein [Bradyrhizobium retamae]KRR22145.1 hypothetical protein CQ13_29900 [Bradyrhizobium retamae]
MLFSAIEDKQTVIRNTKSGVYKQAKLFERKGEIYAGANGGFIRLLVGGRTSHPYMLWDDIEVEFEISKISIGGGLVYVEKRVSN